MDTTSYFISKKNKRVYLGIKENYNPGQTGKIWGKSKEQRRRAHLKEKRGMLGRVLELKVHWRKVGVECDGFSLVELLLGWV